MSRVYAIILSIGAAVIALDQWTKQLALEAFAHEGDSRPFLSWWNFTLVYNRGAAFGMFRGLPDSIRVSFFVLLPVTILAVLWWFYGRKFAPTERLGPISMGLVVGGAIGNLIDRLRHGYVIDFIDWFYRSAGECLPQFHHFTSDTCHWPVFNVADTAITAAMILLVVHSFVQDRAERASRATAAKAAKVAK